MRDSSPTNAGSTSCPRSSRTTCSAIVGATWRTGTCSSAAVERQPDGTLTAGGEPLAFFHFSGYDPDRPQLLSKHQGERPRAVLTKEPIVKDLTDAYATALRAAGFERLKDLPYRYDSLAGGPFPLEVRRIARAALLDPDDTGEPPDPFGGDDGAAFLAWLNEPVISIRGTAVSRLLVGVWKMRVDLQAQFPVIEGPDAVAFARWAAIDDEFQRRYGHLHRPDGLRPAVPFRREPSPGVNVVGYFDAEMGVGEAGRLMVRAAERAGLPIATQIYRHTASRRDAEFSVAGPNRYPVRRQCPVRERGQHAAAHCAARRVTGDRPPPDRTVVLGGRGLPPHDARGAGLHRRGLGDE